MGVGCANCGPLSECTTLLIKANCTVVKRYQILRVTRENFIKNIENYRGSLDNGGVYYFEDLYWPLSLSENFTFHYFNCEKKSQLSTKKKYLFLKQKS